jgi:hypothetical protein
VRATTVRNVAIVMAIAAAVYFVPGGGTSATFVAVLLSLAINVLLVLILGRFYRENRVSLFSLDDRYRGLLYGAVGAAVFAMAARERLFESGGGTLLWLGVIGGASYAVYLVYRHHREYGI